MIQEYNKHFGGGKDKLHVIMLPYITLYNLNELFVYSHVWKGVNFGIKIGNLKKVKRI